MRNLNSYGEGEVVSWEKELAKKTQRTGRSTSESRGGGQRRDERQSKKNGMKGQSGTIGEKKGGLMHRSVCVRHRCPFKETKERWVEKKSKKRGGARIDETFRRYVLYRQKMGVAGQKTEPSYHPVDSTICGGEKGRRGGAKRREAEGYSEGGAHALRKRFARKRLRRGKLRGGGSTLPIGIVVRDNRDGIVVTGSAELPGSSIARKGCENGNKGLPCERTVMPKPTLSGKPFLGRLWRNKESKGTAWVRRHRKKGGTDSMQKKRKVSARS